jgi:hypothetical protein
MNDVCHERGEVRKEWRPRPDGLEESVRFVTGYNCRRRGPKTHGVHGMEIHWYLRGPAGGAHFLMVTDWIPGQRWRGHGLSPEGTNDTWDMYPMGIDVGYHSPRPRFEDQFITKSECDLVPKSSPCYWDGSGLRAMELAKRFIHEGEPVIWAELEAIYAGLSD